jgi:hypothetical protein
MDWGAYAHDDDSAHPDADGVILEVSMRTKRWLHGRMSSDSWLRKIS